MDLAPLGFVPLIDAGEPILRRTVAHVLVQRAGRLLLPEQKLLVLERELERDAREIQNVAALGAARALRVARRRVSPIVVQGNPRAISVSAIGAV